MKNFKNNLFIGLLSLFFSQITYAQCYYITLTTQEEVDNFTNEGCTILDGDLVIGGDQSSNITNLNALSGITEIIGSLEIRGNGELTSLEGLSSLERVWNEIVIQNNTVLENLDGLSVNSDVGLFTNELTIYGNLALTNIDGLMPLWGITSEIGAAIESSSILIKENNNLLNVDGLMNVNVFGGLIVIRDNESLNSIQGLDGICTSLGAIGGVLSGLDIGGNPSLTSLQGLENLKYIGDPLFLIDNDELINLDELSSLEIIEGSLAIEVNEKLSNIDGLSNITSIEGDFFLLGNTTLSDCCILPCFLENVEGQLLITDNNDGCNSIEEIQETCPANGSCDNSFITTFTYYDTNENGIYDGTDYPLLAKIIDITPSSLQIFSGEEGESIYLVAEGTYELSVSNNLWTPTTAPSYTVETTETIEDQYAFGVVPVTDVVLLESNMSSAPTRCGFDVNFWLTYENKGTIPTQGMVEYTPDTLVEFLSANPAPDFVGNGTLYWSYENLLPSYQNQIQLSLQMPGVDEIGTLITSEGFIFALNEDGDTLTQSKFVHNSEITCAYDPNDKLVTPEGVQEEGYTLFTDSLFQYTVRFQNTGNDTAFNIIVRDTLDTDFDWSTFEITASSHEMRSVFYEETGEVEFIFEDIYLPDSNVNEMASHGFLKYEIMPKENLPENTVLENTAGIFFDFNPPIITNTTQNTLVSTLPILIAAVELSVYLEGAFEETTGLMKTALRESGLLPLNQPYTEEPYNYDGLEAVDFYDVFHDSAVDWVLVEVRTGEPGINEHNTEVIEQRAGILLSNGFIVDEFYNENLQFRNMVYGQEYYFVIRYRNHLDIISKTASVATEQMSYDFTTNIDQAFGTFQQKILANGKAAMYTGDYNQDGIIQISDYDVWKENPAQNNVYGAADGTLDGIIQNTDSDAWQPNKAKIGNIEIQF